MKLLWNDGETTGTDAKRHALIQLAVIIEIDGRIVEELDLKMRPMPGKIIDPKALEVNSRTEAEIKQWPSPYGQFNLLRSTLDKYGTAGDKRRRYIPAGYNNGFDLDFISQWHQDMTGGPYAFWDHLQYQPVDVYPIIVTLWRFGMLDIPDCKLGTVCEHFGIQINAHDALSDVRATRELTRLVLEKYRLVQLEQPALDLPL